MSQVLVGSFGLFGPKRRSAAADQSGRAGGVGRLDIGRREPKQKLSSQNGGEGQNRQVRRPGKMPFLPRVVQAHWVISTGYGWQTP
ncbi:MAG: hypothetical protein ACN6PR_16335 [Achromobacter sp.]